MLKRADVVITTYSVLTSEYKAYSMDGADHSKKTKAAPAKNNDSSDSDDLGLGKSLKKKAPAKKTRAKPKYCALYEMGFWRIFLGE